MKVKELRQKTELELKELLTKVNANYLSVVSAILQKKEKNVRKPGQLRKEIARIKTIMTERTNANE